MSKKNGQTLKKITFVGFLFILSFFLFLLKSYELGEAKTKSKTKKQTYKKTRSVSKSPAEVIKYRVKRGDTLYSIAKRFNLSVEELMRLNNLRTSNLSLGQTLIVSKTKVSVKTNSSGHTLYTVKKGDTLFSIAKKFGVSVEDIKRLNDLKDHKLRVGQVLRIESSTGESSGSGVNLRRVLSSEVSSNLSRDLPSDYTWHRVKEGETLYNLSLRYGVPVEEIKRLNHIEDNIIVVGQVLKIPVYREDTFKLENPVTKYEEISKSASSLSVKFSDLFLSKSILDRDEEKALKDKFMEIAEQFKMYAYRLGGSGNGYLDCSMFVKLVFENLGISLPRTSREQFEMGIEVSREELIPGDLVFFSRNRRKEGINHVGIYIGNDRFIHFSSSRKGLAIDSLESEYFKKRFIGAKRILRNGIFFYMFNKDLGDVES